MVFAPQFENSLTHLLCNGAGLGLIEVNYTIKLCRKRNTQEVLGLIPAKHFISAVGKNGSFYARNPQMFLGKDKHVLIFPIDDFETINIVAFTTDRTFWPDRPSKSEVTPL